MTVSDVPQFSQVERRPSPRGPGHTFRDGLRLAALRPTPGLRPVGAGVVAAMMSLIFLASVAGGTAFEWAQGDGTVYFFNEWGLATELAEVMVMLAGAVVGGLVLGRVSVGLSALALSAPLMIVLEPVMIALIVVLEAGRELGIAVRILIALGITLAILGPLIWTPFLAFRRISGRGVFRALVATAAMIGVNIASLAVLPDDTAVLEFYAADVSGAAEEEGIDVEGIYYAQARLMARELGGLAPERPGRTDLFAVLVAGYPYERVFLREIEAAGPILEDRFGATGRTVRLANSKHDPKRYPLANLPNLRAALAGVAERMDQDEDVLFLYLTSHGAESLFSASFWDVGSHDLTAAEIAAALRDADVHNAIIVVSACKSGSFIPYLDRRSYLVMTASAADRNSFGCSDANEWTWFGGSLFETGLAASADFEDAFEAALIQVTKDEEAAGYEPSKPQIHVGADTRPFLEALGTEAAR